jgi:hypothetical protein
VLPRELVPLVNFLDRIRTLPVMLMMIMIVIIIIICTVTNYVTYHEDMGAMEAELHAFSASIL